MSKLELSSGHACWYFPTGSIESNQIRFLDLRHARPRRKALYGIKTRKDESGSRVPVMHWHFAPHAFFSLGDSNQMILEPHVAFTTDGRKLVGDAAKCHRIRRSFCKLWFNEQWRTLHLAYLAAVSGDKAELIIPMSADQSVTVSTAPTTFTSPVTFAAPATKGATDEELVADEGENQSDAESGAEPDDADDFGDEDSE
jgi:hypothetical protein